MTSTELANLSDAEITNRLIQRGYADTEINTFITWRDNDPDINQALRDVLEQPARRGQAIHHQRRP